MISKQFKWIISRLLQREKYNSKKENQLATKIHTYQKKDTNIEEKKVNALPETNEIKNFVKLLKKSLSLSFKKKVLKCSMKINPSTRSIQ